MLFSANKGEQLLPLHKVASGGELARIALAFKSVFRSDTFKPWYLTKSMLASVVILHLR